jgi:hypothetical protein
MHGYCADQCRAWHTDSSSSSCVHEMSVVAAEVPALMRSSGFAVHIRNAPRCCVHIWYRNNWCVVTVLTNGMQQHHNSVNKFTCDRSVSNNKTLTSTIVGSTMKVPYFSLSMTTLQPA